MNRSLRLGSVSSLSVLVAGLCALIARPVHAQLPGADSLAAQIERAVAEEGLVGVTWSLVTPDGITLGAAGIRDASLGTRLAATDRVHVGSVAKAMVATGVLVLVTEGRVALDARVSELLPELQIENPWHADAPLLVRHLLDHTGGLDDARFRQVFTMRGDSDAPLVQALGRRPAITVRHRPGARFSYSNTSYLLLGMLIERLTGERYETWLDGALLAPLAMHGSTFTFTSQRGPAADSALAMGHFAIDATQEAYAIPVRPASQFTTTAADMATFARFLMSDGVVDGRQLVDGDLLRARAVPRGTEAAEAGLAAGYALGLLRRERWGITGNCHLGNIGTFRSVFCVYPESQRAFFAAYNSDPEQGNFNRVDSLLASALGVPETAEGAVAAPSVNPVEWDGWYVVRPNRFEQFAYLDELMGITRVAWDGESLALRPVQGTAMELEPVGAALFRLRGRRAATHVLSRSSDGAWIVSDGLRTYERVPRWRVITRWVSAGAGLVALLYLLVGGGVRTVIALRRRTVRAEVLRWPTLVLWLMVVAPLLYLAQPFLAIGDPTAANIAMALLTGLLPVTIVLALVQRVRAGVAGAGAWLDALALAAALQWCLVLAVWGLVPLMLWR
jgi:CubicO group peptidase (beta-lactamase class C family)